MPKLELDPEAVIRDEVDEDAEVADAVTPSTEADESPAGTSDAEVETEVVAKDEEVETPAKPPSNSFMSEIEADPVKKAIIDRAVEERVKKAYDEKMGKEAGFIRKEVRKEWQGKQKEFEETLDKGKKYDALVAKLAAAEAAKSEPPAAKVADPVADVNARIAEFVKTNDLDESQLPLLAKWSELQRELDSIARRKEIVEVAESAARSTIPRIQAETAWAKEIVEVEAQADFKSNRALRALATTISREDSMSPKMAYKTAREQLGLKPIKTVVGKPVAGKPAYSRGTIADSGEDDAYDGKDPLETLKAKYRKG